MKRRPQPNNRSNNGTPSGLVVGGIAAVVIGLLVLALWVASSSKPPEPAQATPSKSIPVTASSPTPTRRATPAPRKTTASPSPEVKPTKTFEAPVEEEKPSFIKGEFEWVTVKSVTDGDTLKLADGRKVRLLGINTPERKKPLYTEAGDVLKELAGPGTHVVLEFDGARKDRHGRTLAYIHTSDGTFVNGEIVRRGMAYAFIYPTTKIRRAKLIEMAKEARTKNLGVWKLEKPRPGSSFIGNTRAPYFHHLDCERAAKIRGRSKRKFGSRDEAFEAGMHPCRECNS